ncbi:MAG: GntR family transcriptional regulator [Phreatobacter sp.]|uniref:GntR family transcriptional regulator n=1 Tax=Phreatobacter sp. TaxID=1966341 RepID=UPI002735412F|nr:GntR family transcriptional regulator [Phreatobacter sp.]MDP2803079.1 GntR family transcriptional regulator [Phreatobacter sp.]
MTAGIGATVDRRPSRVDDAYAAIKAAIFDGTFAPGYQASAQEIALRLGVSRTPVHEAVLKLQEEGLVRIVPKRGIVICALAPDDVREIYDVMIAIEGRAAELAAARPDADRAAAAARLAAANGRMGAALAAGDIRAWGEADDAFHRALVESAANGRISRIARTVGDQMHRARMLTLHLRGNLGASADEHADIIAAIHAGDGAAADAAARRHRQRTQGELLPLLEAWGLRHL